jgi:single-strand DNA-binding protein
LPQYLTKGAQVAVSGEASLDEWESNGKSGSNLAVNVNDITLIGGKQEQQQQAPRSQSAPAQQQGYASAAQNQAGGFDDFDGDIPF